MQTQVVVGVAQDGLLDEKHVAASLLDLLAQIEDVLALLTKNAIHGSVVWHHHIVLHVALNTAQRSYLETGDESRQPIVAPPLLPRRRL